MSDGLWSAAAERTGQGAGTAWQRLGVRSCWMLERPLPRTREAAAASACPLPEAIAIENTAARAALSPAARVRSVSEKQSEKCDVFQNFEFAAERRKQEKRRRTILGSEDHHLQSWTVAPPQPFSWSSWSSVVWKVTAGACPHSPDSQRPARDPAYPLPSCLQVTAGCRTPSPLPFRM